MKHTNTRALYDYWNTLRNGRAAPYRREIDPRRIAPLLESTFILEAQSRDNVRFRLAGTRLCENFGMELRGMSALALWHGQCRSRVRSAIERVVSTPAIAHLSCTVENRGGFLYNAEFLYMPLKSDNEDYTRILGCGYYIGESDAFAHLYPPAHHWIDSVAIYDTTHEVIHDTSSGNVYASTHDSSRPSSSSGASSARVLPFNTSKGLRLKQRLLSDEESATRPTPRLVTIEGGRTEPLAVGAHRKRGHLRLV